MIEKSNKPSWTPSQESAIETNGCQLLVAAGAGSGKTSVLTERILQKLKSGRDIKDFLVVTFTVASAEDMKEKLRKKLLEAYAKDSENKHISNQIAKLPFARISTITSFCLDLVKRNFTSLGLSPSVRIADESESGTLFENAIDILFDEMFQEKNPHFHTVLTYSGCRGKEKSLEKYLAKLYNKLRCHPNYINVIEKLSLSFENCANNSDDLNGILDTYIGELFKKASDIFLSACERELPPMQELAETIGEKIVEKTDAIASSFFKAKAYAEEEKYSECAASLDELLAVNFNGNPFKNASPEDKAAYNAFKDSLKAKATKASEFFSDIGENALSDVKICAEISKGLKEIIIRLDKIYLELKREKGVLDFTDAEQYAYSLLIDSDGNPTQLCLEIGASTEEVLVDEYQDTNPLQDAIFSALATKDNRFMVGDDKQSIYRFRNAFPDIFNGYKKTFNTEKAKCIRLRENFRCSKEIIDFTNEVFDYLWGEAYSTEKLIFAKDKNKTKSDPQKFVTVKTFKTNLENKDSSVFEAKYIGEEILSLMKTYKTEKGEDLKFSDIAILLPVTSGIDSIFSDVLKEIGIPVTTKKQGALTETPEIKLVLSILKAINNPEEDFSLASAMNSFFFGFTADELAKIRKNSNSSLFGSVLKYSESRSEAEEKYRKRMILRKKWKTNGIKRSNLSQNRTHSELKNKCKNFITRLEELRIKGRQMECKQLIWELYENENLLSTMECAEDGEIKKGNLLLLYTEAIEFGRREYKTLSAFLKHAEKIEISAFSPEDARSVSIMTIHGSKGLEFPICFLANAGKELGGGGGGEKKPVLNLKYGIFTTLKDSSLSTRTPSFYTAVETVEKPEETEEEKRKLYVALTRAKEKLYIVGSCGEKEFLRETYADECKNYLGWILTAHPEGIYINEPLDETLTLISESEESVVSEKAPYEAIFQESDEEEDFVYPHEASVKIPRKLSVSQLKKSENEEYKKTVRKNDFLSVPPFALGKKKVSGAEIGTANHTFMQFASFENCVNFGVEAEGERLLLTGMITDEQYGMLNFKSLRAFFHSELFKKICSSEKVFREKRFTVADNSQSLLGVGNEMVLVQGVIDLFFMNEDGTYTIVDYKTDKIREGEEQLLIDRYKGQLTYYAKAVEEITGKKTAKGIIYSFALNEEIEIPLEK